MRHKRRNQKEKNEKFKDRYNISHRERMKTEKGTK